MNPIATNGADCVICLWCLAVPGCEAAFLAATVVMNLT